MIELNVPNVITIALIAVAALMVLKWAGSKLGKAAPADA